MKNFLTYMSGMVRPASKALGVAVIALIVAGCSSTKITDAQNRVKIDLEIAKLEMAKASMKQIYDSVPELSKESLKEPPPPEPLHVLSLKTFLEENDCAVLLSDGFLEQGIGCYELTRVRLIRETYYADLMSDQLYESQYKRYQLGKLIESMYKVLDIPTTDKDTKK